MFYLMVNGLGFYFGGLWVCLLGIVLDRVGLLVVD